MIFSINYAILVSLTFLFVMFHEFGHILMAKYLGIKVGDITLYPIGGAARIQIKVDEPGKELVVTLAGPIVNLMFCGMFFLLFKFTNFISSDALIVLFAINFVLFVFNMVFAFPLDGGRILRSVLTFILKGNYVLSTIIAVRISQVIYLASLVYGMYFFDVMLIFFSVLMPLIAEMEIHFVQRYYERKIKNEGKI